MDRLSRTAIQAASDEDLVARAIVERTESRTDAFEELVNRHESPLFRFLLLRVGQRAEAEELAQETFLRAFENLERFRPRWRFRTWLFTIAKRLAVSRVRRARSEPLASDSLFDPSEGADPAASSEKREEAANLWDVAARVLSREKRSVLWLRYGEGLDAGEIARVLGKPRVTVRVLLFRARQELGRALGAPDLGARRRRPGAERSPTPRSTSFPPTPSGVLK